MHQGFPPRPPPMPHHPPHQEWDKDYLEYGGASRLSHSRPHPNPVMNPRPLRRPGQAEGNY